MKGFGSHVRGWVVCLTLVLFTVPAMPAFACTDIMVGKDASVDGSVITSHTDCCSESRVHVVPAQSFEKGALAPVYWGLQDVDKPLKDYGMVIGQIPQVEKTYAYFHTGYPQMNEHQLGIGETTISQKNELKATPSNTQAIMTIEQAQLFALQRCTTARNAIKLIGSLVEKYGFLPSCTDDGEALTIADPKEAWDMEVFSVGKGWTPESGRSGAIWAAQRIPDDHVMMIGNHPRIREINLDDPDYFMASANYQQVATEKGWWNPKSGEPFIWQEAYGPVPTEGNLSRLWLFHSTLAPHLKQWPTYAPMSYYPFSIKPEKKLSVQDVMAFQRSWFADTIFDMTGDLDWLVPDGKGAMVKSPLTTPFPTQPMRELLDITWHRNIAQQSYGMIAQLRSWLPDPVGGIYWFYVECPATSTYAPIYAGVQEISPLWSTYNPSKFSWDSARWVIDLAENLMYLRWQDAYKELRKQRDPFEADLFAKLPEVDAQAVALYNKDPEAAKRFLTEYTRSRMEEIYNLYKGLGELYISKFTNNKQGTSQSYRGDGFTYAWPR